MGLFSFGVGVLSLGSGVGCLGVGVRSLGVGVLSLGADSTGVGVRVLGFLGVGDFDFSVAGGVGLRTGVEDFLSSFLVGFVSSSSSASISSS